MKNEIKLDEQIRNSYAKIITAKLNESGNKHNKLALEKLGYSYFTKTQRNKVVSLLVKNGVAFQTKEDKNFGGITINFNETILDDVIQDISDIDVYSKITVPEDVSFIDGSSLKQLYNSLAGIPDNDVLHIYQNQDDYDLKWYNNGKLEDKKTSGSFRVVADKKVLEDAKKTLLNNRLRELYKENLEWAQEELLGTKTPIIKSNKMALPFSTSNNILFEDPKDFTEKEIDERIDNLVNAMKKDQEYIDALKDAKKKVKSFGGFNKFHKEYKAKLEVFVINEKK